jgi:hypothetical protein
VSAWIAVLITPRGALLEGEHALVLNQEVFPNKEAAERRAESQRQVEKWFRPEFSVVVLEIPGAK